MTTTRRGQRHRDAEARLAARIAELLAKAPPIPPPHRMIRLMALMPPVAIPPLRPHTNSAA
jgi:hypothetical protein